MAKTRCELYQNASHELELILKSKSHTLAEINTTANRRKCIFMGIAKKSNLTVNGINIAHVLAFGLICLWIILWK